MYFNILYKIIENCDGMTIYNLSKINQHFYTIIRPLYFYYVLAKNNNPLSNFYPTIQELLKNTSNYNLNQYKINPCVHRKFTAEFIYEVNDYLIDLSYIGHTYYIILPIFIDY